MYEALVTGALGEAFGLNDGSLNRWWGSGSRDWAVSWKTRRRISPGGAHPAQPHPRALRVSRATGYATTVKQDVSWRDATLFARRVRSAKERRYRSSIANPVSQSALRQRRNDVPNINPNSMR
jgi:hypothetical protein